MRMNIDVTYKLDEQVRFTHINATGRINGIVITKNGIMFKVRYIFNGKIEEGIFYADEIRGIRNN